MHRTNWYYFLKEHGFLAVFLVHSVWYGIFMYILAEKVIINELMTKLSLDLSFVFISLAGYLIFKKMGDDVNIDYYDLCVCSILSRAVVRSFTYFDFSEPYYLLLSFVIILIVMAGIVKGKRKFNKWKNNGFLRSLFP